MLACADLEGKGGRGVRTPPPPRKIQISKFNIHCKITENIPRNPTPPPFPGKCFWIRAWLVRGNFKCATI